MWFVLSEGLFQKHNPQPKDRLSLNYFGTPHLASLQFFPVLTCLLKGITSVPKSKQKPIEGRKNTKNTFQYPPKKTEIAKSEIAAQGQIQNLSKVGVHIRVRWGFTSDIP